MVELVGVEDLCLLELGVPWNMEFRKQPEKKDDRVAEAARQMDLILLRFKTNRLSRQDSFGLLDRLSDEVSKIGVPMTVDTEAETTKGPGVVDRLAGFKEWLQSVEDRGHASAMFASLIGWAVGGSIMMLGITLMMVATAPGVVVMFGGVGVLVWLS